MPPQDIINNVKRDVDPEYAYVNNQALPLSEDIPIEVFRWFKFTLKPPNSITHGNLLSAIWDTSHWNFFVKFGLKTA